ncbi:tat pathway signal sequence protein [Diplodia corticola]|uniref:Tat pathway signal sequence protein n=1 Tax=Diplodia corticola TaxID=236234 RepID=A0A1J9RUF5_9PEZI|nr:tat pathway signal sequence protein [Diplodia corticola]OJD36211.1 tat pathway signal sequence protein [Diplodia corticola]
MTTVAAYDELREKAKAFKPKDPLKPTRYWVAVLLEGIEPAQVSEQSSFLWIKANGKTKLDAIHNEYHKRHNDAGPGDFHLQLGPTVLDNTDKMAELNKYEDNLVVLLPVRTTSSAASPTHNGIATASADSSVGPVGNESVQARTPAVPPACIPSPTVAQTPDRLVNPGPVQHSTPVTAMGLASGSQRPAISAPPSACFIYTPPVAASASTTTAPAQPPQGVSQPYNHAWSSQPQAHFMSSPLGSPRPGGSWSPSPFLQHQHQQHQHHHHHHHHRQPSLPSPYANNTPSIANASPTAQGYYSPLSNYPYGSSSKAPSPTASSVSIGHPQLSAQDRSVPPSPATNTFIPNEHEVSLSPEEDTEPAPQNPFLQQLSSETDPEKLEKGVEEAMNLLEKLQESLDEGRTASDDAAQWLQQIEDLKKEVIRSRTVIGVVGNTGAGKSSVINALLDEERLLPTNCMRACTAVVTELSYNESDDAEDRYRAAVEFIKPEEWYKELEILFEDLLTSEGNVSKEATSNPDSEAGVALAKIHAVYPHRTKESLAAGGIEALKRDSSVNNILGTVKHIADSDNDKFYKKLQTYVDSQEKNTGKKKDKKVVTKHMEYWPLIRVVKIYTKAPALSTGAVLVDLPGVHDSNAARAAVADGYMKQCTGLWIVAPITRAVDDKAAKSLLGDSFKRQLKLDGTYGNVSFICSKTDDISNQEAVQSLDLDETAEKAWKEADEMRNQITELKTQLDEHADAKQAFIDAIDDCDDKLEAWEKLRDRLQDGNTVYAPREAKKRKRTSAKSGPKKKRRTTGSDDDYAEEGSDSPGASSSEADSEADSEEESEDRRALTSEEIEAKIQELRSQKKNAKAQRESIDSQQKILRKEVRAFNEKIAAIDHEINALCIKGRNEYSRGAIQQDFAAGIKELDHETALEEDEENFDPEREIRDYDEVARSLPVFCISARAYQKLSGRLKRDKDVSGFSDIIETEMPQLQAHCKKLTETGRAAAGRRFLNHTSQLLNSLFLWASSTRNGSQLSTLQRQKEARFLEFKLVEFQKDLSKVVDETLSDIAEALAQNIYDKYERAITSASEASLPTAEGWGAHRSQGGLYWATYRATVVRHGVFSGAAGPRDFNEELARPMIKQIATGWERAFQRALPAQLDKFKKKTLEVLTTFHNTVTRRASELGVNAATVAALSRQLNSYQPFLTGQIEAIKMMITTVQREVNREFTPVIGAAMEHAYNSCMAERGPGQYMRMKGHMAAHVSHNRMAMFQNACDAVRDRLNDLTSNIKLELARRAEGVHLTARRDYIQVLGNLGTVAAPSQAQTDLKNDVAHILERSEDCFRRLVEGVDEAGDETSQDMSPDEQPHELSSTPQAAQKEEEMTSPTQASENQDRVYEDPEHGSPSLGSGTPTQCKMENTFGSEDKENPENQFNKAGAQQESPNTVTAESAVLQSLSDNV